MPSKNDARVSIRLPSEVVERLDSEAEAANFSTREGWLRSKIYEILDPAPQSRSELDHARTDHMWSQTQASD